MLNWYDKHARELPWRVFVPQKANPYWVYVSEIMLQQTQVTTVIPYFLKFIQKWPTIASLAAASQDEIIANWAGLGYYARARNLHKSAKQIMENHHGNLPESLDQLESLAGIGRYTAAAIAAIAFDKSAVVVDGNIERIMTRLFNHPIPISQSKEQVFQYAKSLTPPNRAGDYAQALMDIGSSICKPKNPDCMICPLNQFCVGYKLGTAASLPTPKAKIAKPERVGIATIHWRGNDEIWLETRPDHGLLGGTLSLPSSSWEQGNSLASDKLLEGEYYGKIRHIFTHFALTLHLYQTAPNQTNLLLGRGQFYRLSELDQLGLSSLMKKAIKLAMK